MDVRKTALRVFVVSAMVALSSQAALAAPVSPATVKTFACGTHTNSTDTPTVNNSSVYVPVYVSGCAGSPSIASTVSVDIEHPRRGDLTIDLVAYDGTEYRLKNSNLLDWRADVHATYTVNLSSEQVNAPWFLKVTDGYSGATGYVDTWSLSL